MATLFTNNALTSVVGGFGVGDTVLNVASGAGQLFAAPTNGDIQVVTLSDALYTRYEIVHLTSRTGDALTVIRGQEGTSEQQWNDGDRVYAALTAAVTTKFARGDTNLVVTAKWDFGQVPTVNGNAVWHAGSVTPPDRLLASTISGAWTFTALPKFNTFDFVTTQGATFVGPVFLSGLPTDDRHAANKAYVDQVAQGLREKESVVAASTANITIATAPGSIDGVALSAGNRILLKNQTDKKENLIYVFTATGQPLTRAPDSSTTGQITSGTTVFVAQGTNNKNSRWTVITSDPITIGTTPIDWTQTSGAGQLTQGNGISINGNTLSVQVNTTNNNLLADSNGLDLTTTGVVANPSAPLDGVSNALLLYNAFIVDTFGRVTRARTLPYARTDGADFTGRLTSSYTPTASTDVTNVDYVLSAINMVSTMKTPVVVAANANLALSGLGTIDGITVKAGDRVLAAGQTNAANNGIYVAASGAWSRASDFAVGSPIYAGVVINVQSGSINANQTFMLTTVGTISVGTTPLTFKRTSGLGLASVLVGSGVTITNDQIGLTETGVSAGTYTAATITVDKYGRITNAIASVSGVSSVFGRTGAVVAQSGDYTFAQIGAKPTTLAGYGITDSVVYRSNGSTDAQRTMNNFLGIDYLNNVATDGPYPMLFVRLTEGARDVDKIGFNIRKETRNSWGIVAAAGADAVNITNGSTLNLRFQTVTVNDSPILTASSIQWQQVTYATGNVSLNAVVGGRYLVDTTALAGSIVLPGAPVMGDTIRIQDSAGKFGTNNLTVSRNNQRIVGLTEDLIINQDNAGCELVYVNSARGWVVFFT